MIFAKSIRPVSVDVDIVGSDRASQLEVCLREYEAIRREMQELLSDINRNYAWVLGAGGILLTSQVLFENAPMIQRTVSEMPWVLLAVAFLTLWFPAYDVTRWFDLRMALEYLSVELSPRIRSLAGTDEVLTWERFRDKQLRRRFPSILPVWLVKFSAPYLASIIAFGMFLLALVASEGPPETVYLVAGALWVALAGSIVYALLTTATLVPGTVATNTIEGLHAA